MVRFVVFGLGMVGRSFLRLAHEAALVDPEAWFALEKSESFRSIFIKYGGKKENFILSEVTQENFSSVFSFLEEGDYLLDFSSFQGNTDLLDFCMDRGIHYLSTCSLPLEINNAKIPDHHDFLIYKELKKKQPLNMATSIIEFGMNPGMVSCFMKQGLKAIVREDDTPYVVEHRSELQELIDQNQYARAAQMLEVSVVHVSDIDTSQVNFEIKPKTVYSTWNLEAFCDESTTFSEISLGTDVPVELFNGRIKEHDANDGYIRLLSSAAVTTEQSYSPWGSFLGYIVPHEEIYTIADFLSVRNEGKLVYKPSVFFIYRPCDVAVQGLLDGYENDFKDYQEHLISLNEIISGGEAVGIVLDGNNFKTRYFGNKMEYPTREDTPTILQVSSSAFAAFIYMLKHKNEGFLFPEELNDEKVLEYAKPYLKEYVTFTCPPLKKLFKS